MSKNLHQIYLTNPLTINASTDLMYIGQSPYGATNDAAITFASFGAQFQPFLTLTNGQLIIGSTGNPAVAANLTASTGITITNGAGSITIASNGANPWVDETGASVTMAVNTGYTSDDGASLVTFTLPTTAAIGDWVEINGKGSGGWTIVYGTSQQIHFGNQASTVTSGSISSTNQFDCVRLRCITANNIFTVVSAVGNLTVA
jgi:hypothetical protein